MKKILLSAALAAFCGIIFSQNCGAPSTGFTPINDLETGTFTNAWNTVWTGGLYPNGSNIMPSAHKNAGMQLANQIQCLDTNGNPDVVNGKEVWLSIGMSNTTLETQQFIPGANAFPTKNPKLVLVDGAVFGQSASRISAPWSPSYMTYWNTVGSRLTVAGVSSKQVQVIWFKEADQATNYTSIQPYYDSLVVMFTRCMHEIKTRFPNVKICYMASRISARYATSPLNPEPYSYYTGWAAKKIIENQINNDPTLQYSGPNANSPWLSWGIYMWSDGSTPQQTNPNVFWVCPADFNVNDGTHPSVTGAQKVANLLLNFFTTDSTATPWFLGNGCSLTSAEETVNRNSTSAFIYPNPFSNSAIVKIITQEKIENAELKIYDILGNEVMSVSNINSSEIKIERTNLNSGIYFCKITLANNFSVTKKIIIN